jgi:hypothetical protein
MRNFRILFPITIIIVIFFSIYSCTKDKISDNYNNETLQTRAAGDCFGTPTPSFNCTTINNDVYSITLPQYPNCEFLVIVPTIKCYSGTDITHFTIGSIISYSTSCFGINQYSFDYNAASNNGTLTSFLNGIAGQLYEAITYQLVTSAAPTNTKSITFNYFISSCSKTCLVSEETKDGKSLLKNLYIKCGSLCCKRVDQWEKINGQWTHWNISLDIVEDISCNVPQGSCPSGTISSTNCYNTCSIFNSF